ncbi:hypothetical protein WJX81_006485 [Elliptochloris bilobata]|uniref:Uncharacterized protein n=1 Tax=Elliptochloris bilobata TaxID=381761 RepID=A0AAW1RPA2_9CHLO
MKRYKVPDHYRRGLRQAIGVGIAVFIGYLLLHGIDERYARQWLQGAKWAAITIVNVGSPVLGKTSQVSLERTLGTVVGGLIGLGVVQLGDSLGPFLSPSDTAFTTVAAMIIGFIGVVAGYYLNLDYSAKLFVLTFILVVLGSDHASDAGIVALTRITGIVAGVMASMLLSCIVFPKSASMSAVDSMQASLDGLAAPLGSPHLGWGGRRLSWDVETPDTVAKRRRKAAERDAREAECEKVLMDVYGKLVKADEFIGVSTSEVYFRTLRGRWCFLPFIPGLCLRRGSTWRLPQREMRELATSIRKVARVLWAVHVTFQEGFEEEVLSVLIKRYPPNLLADLQVFSQACLQDMADAFPREPTPCASNLHSFIEVVDELIRISDQQRRAIGSSSSHGTGSSGPPGSQLGTLREDVPQPPGWAGLDQASRALQEGVSALRGDPLGGSPAGSSAKGSPVTVSVRSTGTPGGASPAAARPPGQQARSPAERALSVRVLGFGCGADYLEGPVSSTPPELAAPQAQERSAEAGGAPPAEMGAAHQGASQAAGEAADSGDQQASAAGVPAEAAAVAGGGLARVLSGRGDARNLDAFPPTTQGYISKVRWYSFQFLCQQLSDELLDMHERMAAVLAALPKPPKPSKLPPQPRASLSEPLLPT